MEIPRSDVEDDDNDDDEESPPPTTTRFSTQLRSAVVPAQEIRRISSAQASLPSAPAPAQEPPVSTPLAPGHSVDAFMDALLSTPSSASKRDE